MAVNNKVFQLQNLSSILPFIMIFSRYIKEIIMHSVANCILSKILLMNIIKSPAEQGYVRYLTSSRM